MIVRDAETTLPACLESVKDLVDEMVIADTGSTDGTLQVAMRFGARYLSIPWENDFARARNQALEHVRTDWVLVLDADEQLDEMASRALPRLLKSHSVDGYLVTILDYVLAVNAKVWDFSTKTNHSRFEPAQRFPAYVEHTNVRLFRRRPQIYFVGCIHESVGPRIVEMRGVLGKADFVIHHFGLTVDAATRTRKNCLYRQLGQKKVQEMPNDAQAHLELGLGEFELRNDEEALKCFTAACRLNPRLGIAWLYQGLALGRLGRPSEALTAFEHAKSICGNSVTIAEGEGDAHYNLRDFDSARRCYKRALTYPNLGPSLESKLGLAEVRLGRTRAGLERLRQAVEKEPGTAEIHDRLIQACVWLNLLEEAADAADHKLAVAAPDPQSFLRAASIHARLGRWEKVAVVLRAGLSRFPEAERLQRCLAELGKKSKLEIRKSAPPDRRGVSCGFAVSNFGDGRAVCKDLCSRADRGR
jgi:tetratricopeptide (TPR) repeat protein